LGHIDTDLVGIGEFGIGEFKDMLEVSSVFKPGRSYFLFDAIFRCIHRIHGQNQDIQITRLKLWFVVRFGGKQKVSSTID
jgi:hypothetical protein